MHIFLAAACAVFMPMSFVQDSEPQREGNTFPVKSILCTEQADKIACSPISLRIALHFGRVRLFALVACVCITKITFSFFAGEISGGESVHPFTCSLAASSLLGSMAVTDGA